MEGLEALLEDAIAAVVGDHVGDRQLLVGGAPQRLDRVHGAAVAGVAQDRARRLGQRHADGGRQAPADAAGGKAVEAVAVAIGDEIVDVAPGGQAFVDDHRSGVSALEICRVRQSGSIGAALPRPSRRDARSARLALQLLLASAASAALALAPARTAELRHDRRQRQQRLAESARTAISAGSSCPCPSRPARVHDRQSFGSGSTSLHTDMRTGSRPVRSAGRIREHARTCR